MGRDIHAEVTERILGLMEEHGTDWIKPFSGGAGSLPRNAETGKPYRGINVFLLWSMPYTSTRWGTYKTWKRIGGQVARGEKATTVVYWSLVDSKRDIGPDGKPKRIPLLRYFNVFNFEQLTEESRAFVGEEEGAPAPVDATEAVELADHVLASSGAIIRHSQQGQAYYAPGPDFIHLPERSCFEATPTSSATECYYSTAFHELTHWTGHASRLDRLTPASFGSPEYAFEELVAELGAAMLCAVTGVSVSPRVDHAHYLNCWKRMLREQPRAITSAAGKASKAAGYLEGLAGLVEAEPEEESEAAAA